MGFLPETDQATTSASGKAGPNKLPNRPPLPGEKLDQSQQLAMDVMAQVVPAWPNLASSIQQINCYIQQLPSGTGISKSTSLNLMASDHLSHVFVLGLMQIQKDASLGDKFLPPLPFFDTVQAPCIMVVAKHHEDGRFMATFLNQVRAHKCASPHFWPCLCTLDYHYQTIVIEQQHDITCCHTHQTPSCTLQAPSASMYVSQAALPSQHHL